MNSRGSSETARGETGSFGREGPRAEVQQPGFEPGSTAWKAVVQGWRPIECRTPDLSKVGIQWQPRLVPELTAKGRIGSEVLASLSNSGLCPRAAPVRCSGGGDNHGSHPKQQANKLGTFTAPNTMEQLAVEMPVIAYYPPWPLYAAISAILGTGFLFLAFRKLRRDKKWGKATLSVTLAAVFAVATAGLVVGSYQQYVAINTWSYDFRLEVQPNETVRESLIVPIPADSSLLTALHLVSGTANWSFVETIHGRGLYVQFIGSAGLDALFSEFAPGGVHHNTTLTMMNSTAQPGPLTVWIFYSGGVVVAVHFASGGMVIPQSESIAPSFRPYQLLSPPVAYKRNRRAYKT